MPSLTNVATHKVLWSFKGFDIHNKQHFEVWLVVWQFDAVGFIFCSLPLPTGEGNPDRVWARKKKNLQNTQTDCWRFLCWKKINIVKKNVMHNSQRNCVKAPGDGYVKACPCALLLWTFFCCILRISYAIIPSCPSKSVGALTTWQNKPYLSHTFFMKDKS